MDSQTSCVRARGGGGGVSMWGFLGYFVKGPFFLDLTTTSQWDDYEYQYFEKKNM